MKDVLIVWAGRHRRRGWEELCSDYRERIRRKVPLREVAVKAKRAGEGAARRREEGAALLSALPDPCWAIALDAHGEALSSEALAAELDRLRHEWPHPVAFVIGSDAGLDRAVLERARRVLSFGPMTLSHELARLVLYEQLYRALDIAAAGRYHK